MGYTQSFLRGIGWSGGLKIFSKGLTVIKIAILARLLSPNDFGLFSLVLVSLSIVEVFAETGINTVIMQSDKKLSYYLDTAWIISIVRGFVIAFFIWLMIWPMTAFYNEPILLPLVLLASVVPMIRGFINPAIVTLQKEMQFGKDTLYRFSLVIVDILAAIIFALVLNNVYALIISIVFQAIADVVLSYRLTTPRPHFRWKTQVAKDIFRHTKWLNGFGVVDYLNKNLDDLIIGRVLGVTNLGYYRNAYATTQSGTAELGLSVIHASFPVYIKIKDDLPRLRRAFSRVLLSFAGVLLLPTMLFCLFPEIIVRIILGPEWLMIVPIVPILAVAGYLQGILNISSNLFISQKRYGWLLTTLGVTLLSMVITIVPLSVQFGLVGAAASILLSRIMAIPFFIYASWQTLYRQSLTTNS